MIYNFLPLFSLNIQSGYIADDNKPIEIFVYSFGLSVNCIFELQGQTSELARFFFMKGNICFLFCFELSPGKSDVVE